MILKSIKYNQGKYGWCIEGRNNMPLHLGQINLIVGQNATGKTKTIEAIRRFSDLISGRLNTDALNLEYQNSNYDLVFHDKSQRIKYALDINHGKVGQELLLVGNIEKLNREKQELFYEKVGEKLSFKIHDNEIAITKGDREQQPFFDKMYEWANGISHYKFGGKMSRDNYKNESDSFTFRTETNVSSVFAHGEKLYGEKFQDIVVKDMKIIEYKIKEIERALIFDMSKIIVREEDLETFTDQHEMSQGMFRALSLIIQLNYSLLSKQPSLILIDDIGEGLDYERSKKLIDLIIKKIEGTQVQLIMTTNDRFVMNKVPLKYWQVIKREKNKSVFYNYENSKQTFDDFTLTGLSNFDFFATEFFVKGFDEYVKVNP